MVLVGADEHDGALVGGDRVGQVVAVVECGRDLEAEHTEQLCDGMGGAASAEHDRVLVVRRADTAADDAACLLAQPSCLQSGAGRFGVGVRVQREHDGADVVLDETERPPRRRVVGVDDRSRSVRAVDHVVSPDHRRADVLDQVVWIGGVHDIK